MAEWKRENLTEIQVSDPHGRWYVARQDIPRLGIRKGHRAFSWRSSLLFVVVPIKGEKGETLGRAIDWEPETFCDWWEQEQVPQETDLRP